MHNFLSYVAHRQTNNQTNKHINASNNIYLLAEVNYGSDLKYKVRICACADLSFLVSHVSESTCNFVDNFLTLAVS